jgi:hypothetical protein
MRQEQIRPLVNHDTLDDRTVQMTPTIELSLCETWNHCGQKTYRPVLVVSDTRIAPDREGHKWIIPLQEIEGQSLLPLSPRDDAMNKVNATEDRYVQWLDDAAAGVEKSPDPISDPVGYQKWFDRKAAAGVGEPKLPKSIREVYREIDNATIERCARWLEHSGAPNGTAQADAMRRALKDKP